MKYSFLHSRVILPLLSLFFFILLIFDFSNLGLSLFWTITSTVLLFACIVAAEYVIKKISFKVFALMSLGLFLGLFVGESLLLFLLRYFPLPLLQSPLSQGAFCLLTSLLGIRLAGLAAEEFFPADAISNVTAKRRILIEPSALLDPRFIDLAGTGLFDGQLIVPAFVVKDFQALAEGIDDAVKGRGKKGLEHLKKLELMPSLQLKIEGTPPIEAEEHAAKWIKLAKHLEAFLICSDSNRFQTAVSDEVKIININTLANILKALNTTGESLLIKIQRYGKEPRQGVGYLDDGTMVVVNGGGEHIGEMVKCFILSIKHTSSGRMIFCNVAEDELGGKSTPLSTLETSAAKQFFAV
jgi:uncharacterized protein YacL